MEVERILEQAAKSPRNNEHSRRWRWKGYLNELPNSSGTTNTAGDQGERDTSTSCLIPQEQRTQQEIMVEGILQRAV
jgi:hypothetical protein